MSRIYKVEVLADDWVRLEVPFDAHVEQLRLVKIPSKYRRESSRQSPPGWSFYEVRGDAWVTLREQIFPGWSWSMVSDERGGQSAAQKEAARQRMRDANEATFKEARESEARRQQAWRDAHQAAYEARKRQSQSGGYRYAWDAARSPGPSSSRERARSAPSAAPPRQSARAVLFVTNDAPWEVIEAAYRALIRKHHPDSGGSEDKAKAINAAFGELKKGR